MNHMRLILAAFLVVVGAGPVWAECPDGQVLEKVGTIVESDTEGGKRIADGPIAINAWSWACTSTACSATFYDGDEVAGEQDDADVVAERAGVASGGGFEEFKAPLYFRDGVSVVGPNLDGVMVYRCTPAI